MNVAEISQIITALSGVIEKGFNYAEANEQRRHKERMFELETSRFAVQAEADLKKAQAEEIRHRIQQDKNA